MTCQRVVRAFHAVAILRAMAEGLDDNILRKDLIAAANGLMLDVRDENLVGIRTWKEYLMVRRDALDATGSTFGRMMSDALYGVTALLMP